MREDPKKMFRDPNMNLKHLQETFDVFITINLPWLSLLVVMIGILSVIFFL